MNAQLNRLRIWMIRHRVPAPMINAVSAIYVKSING